MRVITNPWNPIDSLPAKQLGDGSLRYPRRRQRIRATLASAMRVVLLFGAEPVLELLETPVRTLRMLSGPPPASLPVPVEGVRPADLRDTWGAPRSGGRKHEGIDIFARKGAAIRSTTDGMVWRIGQNRLGGNVVWVLGPGGEMHYYAHLDGFSAIRPGMPVYRGDVLGTVGNTGNARTTPHHLHYGIYTGPDGAINPFPRLKASAKRS